MPGELAGSLRVHQVGRRQGSDAFTKWDDMDPALIKCRCRSDLFEVSVGFSFRADDEIRWVSVGQRCVKDGILGYCADWKIDYGPTRHLLSSV